MSDKISGAASMPAEQDANLALRERLCALVDGELDTKELATTIADCDHKDWVTYQLIGAVMRRSENTAPVSATFAARMSAALEREQPHRLPTETEPLASPFSETKTAGWRRWFAWPAVAMTAAVASVVWIAQPLFESEITPLNLSVSAPAPAPAAPLLATRSAAPIAATVVSAAPVVSAAQDSVYRDYTEAHRQLVGPIASEPMSYMPRSGQ